MGGGGGGCDPLHVGRAYIVEKNWHTEFQTSSTFPYCRKVSVVGGEWVVCKPSLVLSLGPKLNNSCLF